MKKFLIVSMAFAFPLLLQAEQLKFVTTLSSPVGTFAKLETADHTKVTNATKVNFCTKVANGGSINLVSGTGTGAYDAEVTNKLYMDTQTKLKGNVNKYNVSGTLTTQNLSTLNGFKLTATNVNLYNNASRLSVVNGDLQTSKVITVNGAGANSLNVNNGDSWIGSSTANNGVLVWSNQYRKDYKTDGSGTDNSSYVKQFLLKSKGGSKDDDNIPDPDSGTTDPDVKKDEYKWSSLKKVSFPVTVSYKATFVAAGPGHPNPYYTCYVAPEKGVYGQASDMNTLVSFTGPNYNAIKYLTLTCSPNNSATPTNYTPVYSVETGKICEPVTDKGKTFYRTAVCNMTVSVFAEQVAQHKAFALNPKNYTSPSNVTLTGDADSGPSYYTGNNPVCKLDASTHQCTCNVATWTGLVCEKSN